MIVRRAVERAVGAALPPLRRAEVSAEPWGFAIRPAAPDWRWFTRGRLAGISAIVGTSVTLECPYEDYALTGRRLYETLVEAAGGAAEDQAERPRPPRRRGR